MSIIATNVSSFEEIVSRHIKNVKEYGLKDLSNWLERLDAKLYTDRPKHLKIIKIQNRTVLTTIGLLSFKRRYYYDEINDQYLYLLDSFHARPVYLQRQDSIYGHFLICYLAVFALRVLQIKEFKGEIHTNEIISFVRNLKVLKNGETYINLGSKDKIKKINDRLGLNLTNYFLTDKNIKKVLSFKL